MSGQHYTDADVQAAALASCSCQVAPAELHDPGQRIDCAWTDTCVRAALDAVAPAIAARALREFATDRVTTQTAARMREDLCDYADELDPPDTP